MVQYEGIKPIHSYVHSQPAVSSGASLKCDTYDDDFFPVIRLEEDALEVERKAHNEGSRVAMDAWGILGWCKYVEHTRPGI